jgi:hypothetical protein
MSVKEDAKHLARYFINHNIILIPMENVVKNVEDLVRLIMANHEREEFYKHAALISKNAMLHDLFHEFAYQSQVNKDHLSRWLIAYGSAQALDLTKDTIYRKALRWMKFEVSYKRRSLSDCCTTVEAMTQKEYLAVMKDSTLSQATIREIHQHLENFEISSLQLTETLVKPHEAGVANTTNKSVNLA